jgi:hypothetical protein
MAPPQTFVSNNCLQRLPQGSDIVKGEVMPREQRHDGGPWPLFLAKSRSAAYLKH